MDAPSDCRLFALEDLVEAPEGVPLRRGLRCSLVERLQWDLFGAGEVLLDRFPGAVGVSCCFLRVPSSRAKAVRFVAPGLYQLKLCPSGGWLLTPSEGSAPSYWIPQLPLLRRYDSHGRIVSEQPAAFAGIQASTAETSFEFEIAEDANFECVFWRLPSQAGEFLGPLEGPLNLERQPLLTWASHTVLRGPADLYLYLVHGSVYENRFDFRRQRKICCELEAYSIYVALLGLEVASGKPFYSLLRRQVVISVIARQSADGGWRHGEWTDFMESHFRFQNAAIQLLAAACEEWRDELVHEALEKAAAFISRRTDRTRIGLWFLHDSLEESPEQMNQSGARWVPTGMLGKSPANKLILNTHLDAIVALDRYREVTGDAQYSEKVDSARAAARAMLALRPAEWLYRLAYWPVRLTLLPSDEARRLSLPLRAIKRLTRDYLLPRLHLLKRSFPRIVMPGGLIERHVARLHFGADYQGVNVMDLTRVWRRFPEDNPGELLDQAISAATRTGLVKSWAESKRSQAIGTWIEALYHVCTMRPQSDFRRLLAEAICIAEDAGLGLPPSLLGTNPEVVKRDEQTACPSPSDPRLRVANLSCGKRTEFLVVNCSTAGIEFTWQRDTRHALTWTSAHGQCLESTNPRLCVPARGWLWGRTSQTG